MSVLRVCVTCAPRVCVFVFYSVCMRARVLLTLVYAISGTLWTCLQISCLLLTETVEKGKSQEKFGLAENKAGPDREFILQVRIICR